MTKLLKIGLPALILGGMLVLGGSKASAATRFGVFVGPAYPAYPYTYSYPYYYDPFYDPYYTPYYPYPYTYRYSYPYYGGAYRFGGHRDFDRHEHFRDRDDRGFRGGEHGFRGGGEHGHRR